MKPVKPDGTQTAPTLGAGSWGSGASPPRPPLASGLGPAPSLRPVSCPRPAPGPLPFPPGPRAGPAPPSHVRRLVPAPLLARGPAPRVPDAPTARQPRALPAAPLPARLGLGPRRRRRLAPSGRSARAQPSPGPRAALERRLRRVSALPRRPPPRSPGPDLCRARLGPWAALTQAEPSGGTPDPNLWKAPTVLPADS